MKRTENKKLKILQLVHKGELSPEQALEKLNQLDDKPVKLSWKEYEEALTRAYNANRPLVSTKNTIWDDEEWNDDWLRVR